MNIIQDGIISWLFYKISVIISAKEAVKFGNDNWKLMLNTFGKPVVEKALKIAFDIISKFYNFVPAKYYLSDDLSSYS